MKVKELESPKFWPGHIGEGYCRIKGTVIGDSIWIKHRDLVALGEEMVEHGYLAEDEGFEGEDDEFHPEYFVAACQP